jgi:hypothetical protein
MKNVLASSASFLAVLAAFALLPVSLPVATGALAIVGLVAVMSVDYAAAPLRVPSGNDLLPFPAASASSSDFRQAA